MRLIDNRRKFIINVTISGVSLGLAGKIVDAAALPPVVNNPIINIPVPIFLPDVLFVPRRAANWLGSIEDLLWCEKAIVDKIKYGAEGFAKANMIPPLISAFTSGLPVPTVGYRQ
jgi:hypothetical protein